MGIYGKEDFELMIHMRKVNLAVLAVLTGMFPLNLEILSLSHNTASLSSSSSHMAVLDPWN